MPRLLPQPLFLLLFHKLMALLVAERISQRCKDSDGFPKHPAFQFQPPQAWNLNLRENLHVVGNVPLVSMTDKRMLHQKHMIRQRYVLWRSLRDVILQAKQVDQLVWVRLGEILLHIQNFLVVVWILPLPADKKYPF